MVDISTPASVLDRIALAVRAHMDANSTEFRVGSAAVSFTSNSDPLKVQLVVGFEFSHNGMPLGVTGQLYPCMVMQQYMCAQRPTIHGRWWLQLPLNDVRFMQKWKYQHYNAPCMCWLSI